MIRGTTPTQIFNLPFEASRVKELCITYQQNGETVLEKAKADCTLDGSAIILKLTQEETLLFSDKQNVSYQLKVLTTDGEVLANKIATIPVDRILCEEVLQ